MINFIKGTLDKVSQGKIIVENPIGMGYEIHTNKKTIISIKNKIGQQVKIYTYLHVREDIMKLYGFMSEEENNFFRLLISANGVGPSSALNILEVDAQEFCMAIVNNDAKLLAKMRIKGVGDKTAEKLIVELKTKVKELSREDVEQEVVATKVGLYVDKDVYEDAKTALMTLGYSSKEAKQAIDECYTEKMSVSDIIQKTLRYFAVQKNI